MSVDAASPASRLVDLLVEDNGGVVTITINRPERRNALGHRTLEELGDVFMSLRDSKTPKVVIMRGAGSEAFSGGFDLSQETALKRQLEGHGNPLDATFEVIRTHPYPVIAMIHGYCIGAGLDLAATCDIRIASLNARFAMTPARIGTLYGGRGTLNILRLVGPGFAAELFLSGRTVDAQGALAMGLVNDIEEPDQLEGAARELAGRIAQNAPLSLRFTKQTLSLLEALAIPPATQHCLDAMAATVYASHDFAEGRRAFAEKRKPAFQGE